MWYFSWILGLGLALTFGVLNAIWFEVTEDRRPPPAPSGLSDTPPL
jgi:cytochrome bd-I ubiquinol oxidase subunit X